MMDIVNFFIDENYGGYSCKNASNIEMCTLGNFLSSEIGCGYPSSFKEWGVNDNWGDETNGNLTILKKDGDYILLGDLFSEEPIPTMLRMTRKQYVQVITDWEEKVCKLRPKEVTITYQYDEFKIETKD